MFCARTSSLYFSWLGKVVGLKSLALSISAYALATRVGVSLSWPLSTSWPSATRKSAMACSAAVWSMPIARVVPMVDVPDGETGTCRVFTELCSLVKSNFGEEAWM